ncbi:hypothetical protein ACIG3E_32525 [Streptomyces sp. NPDC053474]|uniref:hypothetical protein n=1 Tax=Streptomyces sp. NPDC053474 TaxID=3365704 RepID=UPI0037D05772
MAETSDAMVQLRTGGAPVPESLLILLLMRMRTLADTDPAALVELAAVSRDPQHRVRPGKAEILSSFGFEVGPRGPRDRTVRDVVLAATEGEGRSLRLVSPLPDSEETRERDRHWMRRALALAGQCPRSDSAYAVGAAS